jgi:hypothetical protein
MLGSSPSHEGLPIPAFIFKGLAERKGVELRRINNVNGEILMSDMAKAIDDRIKLVSLNQTMCWWALPTI